MTRTSLAVFTCLLSSSAAVALNNRSAVSVNGLDSSACTVASPCRSFGVALVATADGGEVVALDSAGYGPFSIAKSVTVTGAPGVHAAITATAGDAIAVTAGNYVVIGNLFILGNGSGSNGIVNTGAGFLHVVNCFVQGFLSRGVHSTATATKTVVDHCTFENNSVGIEFDDTAGTVDNCSVNFNATGIVLSSTTALIVAYITQTTFRFNEMGMDLAENAGAYVVVEHSSFYGDNYTGFRVFGADLTMNWVLLNFNFIDLLVARGHYEVFTFGNNLIHNLDADSPLIPSSLQ
jgi:hypothetical protein